MLIALLLIASFSGAQDGDAEASISALRQGLSELSARYYVPGLAVAVTQGQQLLYAEGFGYADIENDVPVTPDTPFHIASLTKPLAATVLVQAVEAGQLDLDAALAELLKETRFEPAPGFVLEGYAAFCTQLRGMVAEVEDALRPLFEDYRCDTETLTVKHHLTHTAQGEPGETFRYNGMLYGFMLAAVAAEVSGEPFPSLLTDRITRPLDMTHTLPTDDEAQRQRVLEALAQPYTYTDGAFARSSCGSQDGCGEPNAGSGVVSSVLDLAKFDLALDQNTLVSHQTKALMFTPASSGAGALPYGLGWFVQNVAGAELVWHYGYIPGAYSGLILKVPEENLTLLLLANSDALSAPFSLSAGDVLGSPFAVMFLEAFALD